MPEETDTSPPSGQQRGSVLVAVLAMIMLLSFLVTQVMNEALEDLEYRSLFSEPVELRSYAFSMMELSLATVQEIALIDEGKLYAPEQGWSDPLAYAGVRPPNGWQVAIEIHDESGKLPLNRLEEAQLNRLLEESLEFDFGTSRELSSMLLDWIDPDDSRRLNGAESEDYLRRDPPYKAANAPLQSLEELRLIEVWDETFFDEAGRPNEQFEQLERMVTVRHGGTVNLNSAHARTLELLALGDGYDDRSLFDGLDRDQPYLKRLPEGADSEFSSTEIQLLRVTVKVFRGDLPYTIHALVEPAFADGESASNRGRAPGTRDRSALRKGSMEEQNALNYPFRILRLSEFLPGKKESMTPARYSVVDIGENSPSLFEVSF